MNPQISSTPQEMLGNLEQGEGIVSKAMQSIRAGTAAKILGVSVMLGTGGIGAEKGYAQEQVIPVAMSSESVEIAQENVSEMLRQITHPLNREFYTEIVREFEALPLESQYAIANAFFGSGGVTNEGGTVIDSLLPEEQAFLQRIRVAPILRERILAFVLESHDERSREYRSVSLALDKFEEGDFGSTWESRLLQYGGGYVHYLPEFVSVVISEEDVAASRARGEELAEELEASRARGEELAREGEELAKELESAESELAAAQSELAAAQSEGAAAIAAAEERLEAARETRDRLRQVLHALNGS